MAENLSESKNQNNGFDSKIRFKWLQGLSIFLIGAGIGWLSGLSVSPVIAGIIASLLGIVAGVVTGINSLQYKNSEATPRFFADARPAAILVISIALFAPIGIVARTYHVFEPQKIYNNGKGTSVPTDYQRNQQNQGVLFMAQQKKCNQLLSLSTMGNYEAFVAESIRSEIPMIKELVLEFKDDQDTLYRVVKTVCTYHQ